MGKLFGKITHETDLNKRASEEAIERVASRCSRRYKKANMTAMAQAKEFVGCHLEDGDSDFGENFSEPLKAAVFFEGRLQDHDVSKAEAYELLVALVKSIQHHHSTGSSVSRLFRADPRLCERDVPPMTMAKKFTEDKTLERAWWSHLSEIATDESTPPQGSEENFQEEEAEERELDLAQRQDPESRKTPAEIKLESGGVVKQLDYPPQGFFSGESGSWRLEEEQRIEALLR